MYNDDLEGDYIDTSLDGFANYDAYLDHHITDRDLFYLEDRELARKLISLGYQSQGEFLQREEFERKKKEIEEAIKNKNSNQPKSLASAGCNLSHSVFLQELAKREENVRNGRMTTIIFIRCEKKNMEVSGYIDLADRLRTDDFKEYFEGTKKLIPRKTDLSFYNWDTQKWYISDSKNFRVDANSDEGLIFRNTRDRKPINVRPDKDPGDGTTRTDVETTEYIQVVFFDHLTRRKH